MLNAAIAGLPPPSAEARPVLAEAWFTLGEVHRANGDRAAAAKAWSSAFDTMRDVGPMATDVRLASLWVRILARLHRTDETRAMRARLHEMGYRNADLEQICKEEGC
jgi:hypothetical protein